MATVLGLFDESLKVEEIARSLIQAGFDPNSVRIVSDDQNDLSTDEQIAELGLDTARAQPYIEGLGRGDNLLIVTAPESQARQAADLFRRFGARQISGGNGLPASADYAPDATTNPTAMPTGYSADYQPTGVPAGSTLVAFQEGILEIPTMAEELIVEKRARVVEEISLSKVTGERIETVRENLRRSEVEVQPIAERTEGQTPASNRAVIQEFRAYEPDFRVHYRKNLSDSGANTAFEQYEPAYHYGYDAARDPRYSQSNWSAIEPEVQQDWEKYNPGTWQQVKDRIQYGFERVHRQ